MAKTLSEQTVDFIHGLSGSYLENSYIPPELYHKYQVKRGLRNEDNTGVMAGLTRIGNVRGYYIQDGERMPTQGQLIYRGIDVEDLIQGCSSENRFGFEETCYLLLMGSQHAI